MASLKTSLELYDGVSGPLKNISATLGSVVDGFENLQEANDRAVDASGWSDARSKIEEVAYAVDDVEDNLQDASAAQEDFNRNMKAAQNPADALLDKVKSLVKMYVSIQGMKKIGSFFMESLSFADTQASAEAQLQNVLKNVGAAEGAFDDLKAKASSIQQAGIYGDEVMLGGAAELSTYLSDPEAIKTMMDTLSDYAAGMSGGGEVSYEQMVEYATQLGKAVDGTYDGLKKKGFELTDAQKQIIDNGTDMEKALTLSEVIGQSWDGLYETMSNTPQAKIIQLKNAWGDIREEIGVQLYPTIARVVQIIQTHMPQISATILSIGRIIGSIIELLANIMEILAPMIDLLAEFDLFIPIIFSIVGALVAWKVAVMALKVAQVLFNASLNACPIFLIITAIMVIIGLIMWLVNLVGGWGNLWTYTCAAAEIAWVAVNNTVMSGILWMVYGIEWLADKFITAWEAVRIFFMQIWDGMATVFETIIGGFMSGLEGLVNFVIDALNKIIDAYNMVAWIWGGTVSEDQKLKHWNGGTEYNNWAASEQVKRHNDITAAEIGAEQAWTHRQAEMADTANAAKDTFNEIGNFAAERWQKATDEVAANNAAAEAAKKRDENAALKAAGAGGADLESMAGSGDYDQIAQNVSDITDNTEKIADNTDQSETELKFLREIAERQAINQFTTAELKIEMTNHNTVTGTDDIDGIVDKLNDKVRTAMIEVSEGVHK